MSGFKVLELVARAGNPVAKWVFDERTGFFNLKMIIDGSDALGNHEPMGFYDLVLGQYHFKPIKVRDTENNRTLSVGDRLENTGITSFVIKQNRCYINSTILLRDAILYVEPTPVATLPTPTGVNNFTDIQDRILRDGVALKLGSPTNEFTNPTQSLTDFLANFFVTYNNHYRTSYVSTNRVQTEPGRRRSLGDIFRICKFYYSDCSLHEVIRILYQVLPTDRRTRNLGSLICSQIHKRVWWIYTNPRFDHATDPDEFGNTKQYYIDNLVIPEPVVDTEAEEAVESVYESIVRQFAPGVRFRSMTRRDHRFAVETTEFYNGNLAIYTISNDGNRRKIYDKETRTTATIVR